MKRKNLVKASAVLSLIFSTSIIAIAQEQKETTTAAPSKFGVSLNGGLCFSYTDVKPSGTAPVFGLGGHYYATPYIHANIDVQKGWLKAGDHSSTTSGIMGSDNSYFSMALTARFLPLGLIKDSKSEALKYLSEIYGGVGLGFIANSVKANTIISPDFGSLGDYSGTALFLPIEAGINVPVLLMTNNKSLSINVNYRVNLAFSDKIDGYVPNVAANEKNDAFNTLTAGLVLKF